MLLYRQLIWGRFLLANITGWQVLRVILSLTLLAAALFKVHELSTTPYLDKFPPRWVMIVFTELEILFALWLFFVPKRLTQITWFATLGLFSFFTCVTLYKALIGAESCGCFGRVEINPWYTLIFDSTVVAALFYWRPRGLALSLVGMPLAALPKQFLVVGLFWLLLAIPAAVAMGRYQPAQVVESGEILGDSQFVVLEPEKWVGKPCPLLSHIDIGDRLSEGEWIVLLFHHDCPDCQDVIPVYASLSCEFSNEGKSRQIALIEIPPFDNLNEIGHTKISSCVKARMSESREWFVEAPVEIRLSQGVVTGITGRDEMVSKRAISKHIDFSTKYLVKSNRNFMQETWNWSH